jgi:hypothetical protein
MAKTEREPLHGLSQTLTMGGRDEKDIFELTVTILHFEMPRRNH